MKNNFLKIIFGAFLLLNCAKMSAQMSCCAAESLADYQLLGGAADFTNAHAEPLPFHFESKSGGEMVKFATPDTATANAFLIKSKKKSKKWLFVYQEWWGLNDYIKRQAEIFYDSLGGAVNVMAIDMYDGKVTDKREEAGKLMSGASQERLNAIMRGAVAYAGKRARVASVGWCFGGGLSLRSAILSKKQAVGCIMYYGMPVKEVEALKGLNTDVLGFFAGREKWISPKVVAEFAENMKKAGKTLDYTIFDNEHAFANPSNPNFDATASATAFGKAMVYLKSRFKL